MGFEFAGTFELVLVAAKEMAEVDVAKTERIASARAVMVTGEGQPSMESRY